MKEGGIIAGASRARTDGLVIANDGVLQIASFACLHLQSSHVPLHSKTFSKFQVRRESCLTVFPARPWLQARHFLTRPQPRMFTAQSRLASPAWLQFLLQIRNPAARICSSCKKKPLSYNNATGICAQCQGRQGGRVRSKKTDGRNGAELRPEVRSTRLSLLILVFAQTCSTSPSRATISYKTGLTKNPMKSREMRPATMTMANGL